TLEGRGHVLPDAVEEDLDAARVNLGEGGDVVDVAAKNGPQIVLLVVKANRLPCQGLQLSLSGVFERHQGQLILRVSLVGQLWSREGTRRRHSLGAGGLPDLFDGDAVGIGEVGEQAGNKRSVGHERTHPVDCSKELSESVYLGL